MKCNGTLQGAWKDKQLEQPSVAHKRDSIRRSTPEGPGMLVITSWNVQGLLV